MRKANVEQLLKQRVLPSLPGFAVKGRLLYDLRRTGILRGFYFDQSASKSDLVYVQSFVMPLFVPSAVLSFNYGERLRHPRTRNTGWDLKGGESDDLASLVAVLDRSRKTYLDRIETSKDFAERFVSSCTRDLYALEAVGYAWILCGDDRRAAKVLARASCIESGAAWMREVVLRCERVRLLLSEQGAKTAKLLLSEWQKESEKSLRLWEAR